MPRPSEEEAAATSVELHQKQLRDDVLLENPDHILKYLSIDKKASELSSFKS